MTNTKTLQPIKNTKDLESVKEVLIEMIGSLKMSHDLLDCGVQDSVSTFLKDLLTQPKIATGYDILEKAQEIIYSELSGVVNTFLIGNKEILHKVYCVKDGENEMFYAIIFKEDNISNRAKLNDFLMLYESTPFEKHFPLIFQYIPKELEKDINGSELLLE